MSSPDAADQTSTDPATPVGTTTSAGEGVDDQDLAREVAEQTSSDLKSEQVFENEAEGTYTDTEVQKADAEELGG